MKRIDDSGEMQTVDSLCYVVRRFVLADGLFTASGKCLANVRAERRGGDL